MGSSNWKRLFSESHGRFLIETSAPEELTARFASAGVPAVMIGSVTETDRLKISGGGHVVVDAPIAELKEAWQAPMRW